MATSLDLSRVTDLKLLAALIREVQAVAAGAPFLLAGAMARDLHLKYAHGVPTARGTEDVDLAFLVSSWNQFEQLRSDLLAHGFKEIPKKGIHKLRYKGTVEVDILPFGGVEQADRTILLPPDNVYKLSMFGFSEAMKSAVKVLLPDGIEALVVSLPALAILKFSAWSERRLSDPGKDAYDLQLIIRNYAVTVGDRLYEANPYVMGSPSDYEGASAWLLGKDMAALLDAKGHNYLARLIGDEADPDGQLRLAGEMMRHEPERALQLLAALEDGFVGESGER